MMGVLLVALLAGQGMFGVGGETQIVVITTELEDTPRLEEDIQDVLQPMVAGKVGWVESSVYGRALRRRQILASAASSPQTIKAVAAELKLTHAVVLEGTTGRGEPRRRGYGQRSQGVRLSMVKADTGRRLLTREYALMNSTLPPEAMKALVHDVVQTLSPSDSALPDAFETTSTGALSLSDDDGVIMVDDGSGDDDVVVVDDDESDDDEGVIIFDDDSDDADDAVVIFDDDSEDDAVVIDDEESTDSYSTPSTFTMQQARTYLSGEFSMQGVSDLSFESNGEDVIEWWNFGRMKLDYKASSSLRAVAEMWMRWGVVGEEAKEGETFYVLNAGNGKWASDIQLREGYIAWKSSGLTLKLGQRIFVWGKNEYLPAADVLNPTDVRYGLLPSLGSTRDGKVPIFALDTTYWFGETGLQLVVAPFFTAGRSYFYGRDFALAAPGTEQERQLQVLGNVHPSIQDRVQDSFWGTEVPVDSLVGASGALRLVTSVLGWDLAFTGYYGWDRTPEITMDDDMKALLFSAQAVSADPQVAILDPGVRAQSLVVQQKIAAGQEVFKVGYQRMMRFAFEAQGIVGPYVFRMDLGFSPKLLYFTSTLDSVALPTAFAVAGLEYTYGESLYLSMTTFGTFLFGPPSGATLFGVEKTLAAGEFAGERDAISNYGGLGVIRYNFVEQNLELSLSGMYNVDPGSYLATAQIKTTHWEPHDIRVGAMVLGGPKGTLLGNFDGNDFAYVQYGATW
ncbi:MAG: hypothetical protein VX699_10695 [Myxococcota bacterium]|nr:hypothetical protein [Myxococcota bacterium]